MQNKNENYSVKISSFDKGYIKYWLIKPKANIRIRPNCENSLKQVNICRKKHLQILKYKVLIQHKSTDKTRSGSRRYANIFSKVIISFRGKIISNMM